MRTLALILIAASIAPAPAPPNIYPPLSLFQFSPLHVGYPQRYVAMGGQTPYPHASGKVTAVVEELPYQQYYYGVKPLGAARGGVGLYTLDTFTSTLTASDVNIIFARQAGTNIGGNITPGQLQRQRKPLTASQWLTIPELPPCWVYGGFAFRNIVVTTLVILDLPKASDRGCGREQSWSRSVQFYAYHALVLYAEHHTTDQHD